MTIAPADSQIALKRWTADDYRRMLDAGILTEGDRAELLDGQIVEMSPQNPPHARLLRNAMTLLPSLVAGRAAVQFQLPVTLPPDSEPEPDIAIVRLAADGYRDRHPGPPDLLLVVEVADATLRTDLGLKAQLYARHGIPDYWVLDARDRAPENRRVWVHRSPGTAGYDEISEHPAAATLTPIAPELAELAIALATWF